MGIAMQHLAQLRLLPILTRPRKTELKMTREYSRKLQWRVIFLLREGCRVANIASVLQVGETFVRIIVIKRRQKNN